MKWIGLTGGIGSGKSTAAHYFKKLGVPVLDADEIAKNVAEKGRPGYNLIIQEFGPGILHYDQSLDRQKLGEIVFSNKDKLSKLESILHPLVQKEIKKQKHDLAQQGHAYALYDVPLLFEKNLQGFDAVIVVNCPMSERIKRIQQRNQWSDAEIQKRINAQISLEEKVEKADYVIQNSGNQDQLNQEVKRVHQLLMSST